MENTLFAILSLYLLNLHLQSSTNSDHVCDLQSRLSEYLKRTLSKTSVKNLLQKHFGDSHQWGDNHFGVGKLVWCKSIHFSRRCSQKWFLHFHSQWPWPSTFWSESYFCGVSVLSEWCMWQSDRQTGIYHKNDAFSMVKCIWQCV